ncbi:Uncharacterised protein [Chlamydia trachomatis]|nr:Uncharacterised protein [Chlamydia trachomatis]
MHRRAGLTVECPILWEIVRFGECAHIGEVSIPLGARLCTGSGSMCKHCHTMWCPREDITGQHGFVLRPQSAYERSCETSGVLKRNSHVTRQTFRTWRDQSCLAKGTLRVGNRPTIRCNEASKKDWKNARNTSSSCAA